ncbi:MAG: hypothetical protein NTV80_02530 [Verrucomicrobia bacterium]|nr:hypothetical protein [Verrucomicrobiota bacterium]
MNDQDIESLFKSLSPAMPSVALTESVDRELEQDLSWARTPKKAPNLGWFAPVMWTSLGAAAAVLVMSAVPASSVTTGSPALSQAPSVMPMSTIREVMEAQDEGIQYNDVSRLPEQHVRLVSMERHAWIDPRDGAQITVEMPREDSVILPVSFQ